MAILKINNANPGVKRPLKVEDLANIWEGLNSALAQGTDTTPRILCGFNVDNNILTPGAIAYKGKIYINDSEDIALGDTIYGVEESTGDNRVMSDGTTQLFSYARRVGLDSGVAGAVLIGEASTDNLNLWRKVYIPVGGIGTNEIEDGSITQPKIAMGAVGNNELEDESVTNDKLAELSVGYRVLAKQAIMQDNIATGGPGAKQVKQMQWTVAADIYFTTDAVNIVIISSPVENAAAVFVPNKLSTAQNYRSYFTNPTNNKITLQINRYPSTLLSNISIPAGSSVCVDAYTPGTGSTLNAVIAAYPISNLGYS